jgi:hypothetical protein
VRDAEQRADVQIARVVMQRERVVEHAVPLVAVPHQACARQKKQEERLVEKSRARHGRDDVESR